MKYIVLFAATLFLISCKDTKKSVIETFSNKNPVDQSCECLYSKEDFVPLYATNLEINQKTISFNCAQLEVAIAEKADVNGVPQGCTNLYSLKCVSTKSQQLILNDSFTYSKSETSTDKQTDFFETQKQNPKAIYRFSLNNQNQIIEIEQLKP